MRFWKLSGAGNDFVLLEAGAARRPAALARRLCDRREGVGADGLLLVRRAGAGRGRVAYFNADGSRAFCGNGTRCAAWWLHQRGGARKLRLDTDEGQVEAVIAAPGRVRVLMPQPKGLRLGLRLAAAGRRWLAHFVDAGVPHAVVVVRDVERIPVEEAGRALRRHSAFGREGANVDFVAAAGRRPAAVRTYERGVEGETLACGTGAVAAAVVLEALKAARLPALLRTRGGSLRVSRDAAGLWLEGPARVTFTGEVLP